MLLLPLLILSGLMVWEVFLLGVLVGLPYILANLIGAWLFDPAQARLFRIVAYMVIAASAITI